LSQPVFFLFSSAVIFCLPSSFYQVGIVSIAFGLCGFDLLSHG